MLGGYTVTLKATSDEGCVDFASKSIGIITGIETSLAKTTSLYPNPIYDGVLFVEYNGSKDPIKMEVFNAQGKLVLTQTIEANLTQTSLDVTGLTGGVYLMQMRTRDEMLTRKIVVVR